MAFTEANSVSFKFGQSPEFNPRCDSGNSVNPENSDPVHQNSTRGVILQILLQFCSNLRQPEAEMQHRRVGGTPTPQYPEFNPRCDSANSVNSAPILLTFAPNSGPKMPVASKKRFYGDFSGPQPHQIPRQCRR